MPKVSKRGQRRQSSKPEVKYLRTYIYVRLSEKDGGHGRRDSIYIQKQICEDYAKKHPEMLVVKVYADNGVTGTTFQRDAFEELMEDVANKKVDCIIVKDFARFGRDALDAVDLIDVIFPTLNIRFVSVMDEYDSANPACVEDRTTNILKHFMNDYYAREVSEKLVQAHRLSRERGEFWGSRPPYGYQRAEENSKKLVPEPEEAEIIRQIFYWYVFEEMSSYDIARELNGRKVLGPEDSYYHLSLRDKLIYKSRIESVPSSTGTYISSESYFISLFVACIILLDIIDIPEKKKFLEGKSTFVASVLPELKAYQRFVNRLIGDGNSTVEESQFQSNCEEVVKVYKYAFETESDEYYERFEISRELKQKCIAASNGHKYY